MSCTSKPEFNSFSIANGCLILVPAIFSSKTSYSNLSIPSKLIKLNLSCSLSSSLPSPFSLTKTTHSSSVVAFVAQTSNLTQQEDREIDEIEDSGEEGFADADDSYQEPPEGAKLFVANLPYDVDCEKLAYMFDQAGIVEVAEVVYDRETDKSRGFGFVTMRTVEEADKAVEMFHRYDINGRRLTVHKDVARGSRPAPVYEPNYRIYVGSLPWDVDSAHLEQMFSKYGKVVGARVVYDRETNCSRGFGFVEMSTEAELNDAVANLDGQNLGGRAIKVSVAKRSRSSARVTNAVE